MNCILVKTMSNKNFPSASEKNEIKIEGPKGKSGGAYRAKQQTVLAALETQNKLISEEDKLPLPNDNTSKLLLSFFFPPTGKKMKGYS